MSDDAPPPPESPGSPEPPPSAPSQVHFPASDSPKPANSKSPPPPTTEPEPPQPPFAWQPLTPRGVARFADATLSRVLLVELIFAIVAASTVVWVLQRDYVPVISHAVDAMPDGARVRNRRLQGIPDTLLFQNQFLALAIAPSDDTDLGQSADLQVQFRPADVRIGVVFLPSWGLVFSYENGDYDLSRASLEPLWGAWRPVVLTECGAAVALALGLTWTILAFLLTAPVRIAAWFADRRLTLGGAWRLSGASLMSGALLLTLAVALYGLRAIDLIGLACFLAGHFILDVITLAASFRALDRAVPAPPKNPFLSPR